jgi:isocitrate lyase
MMLVRILGEDRTFIREFLGAYNFCYSDYPYTTVPNQVQRIFKAQQLHDKKHYDARMSVTLEAREKMPYVDYLRPIIADGDTG